MSLIEHGKDELRRAGLYDADADYNGMIGTAVEELLDTFAKQGHSGFSASLTLSVFQKLARFEPLTPLTNDPSEWMDVAEYNDGNGMWQSRRRPDAFSTDGGRTYYLVDTPDEILTSAEAKP